MIVNFAFIYGSQIEQLEAPTDGAPGKYLVTGRNTKDDQEVTIECNTVSSRAMQLLTYMSCTIEYNIKVTVECRTE